MTTPPLVAVGERRAGILGGEVWPETREQGCWCHKLGNVLDKLPQRLQPRAKRTLHEMMYAECRADCEASTRAVSRRSISSSTSKAVESLTC